MHSSNSSRGFSLIEVLIVMTILVILIIAGIGMYMKQLAKSRDAQRKSDLDRIKIAFADYYGDNDCFPGDGALLNCGGADLAPYLKEIPCDPLTEQPYKLSIDVGSLCPNRYRVLTTLELDTDPVISVVHCDGPDGCGVGLEAYNYGVSDGIPVSSGDVLDGGGSVGGAPTSTPTPTLDPGVPTSTPTPTLAPGVPTNTPTPTPTLDPGVPTSTPTPTLDPGLPTNTPAPVVGADFCCNNDTYNCEEWDLISPCSGTYASYAECVDAPNNCDN